MDAVTRTLKTIAAIRSESRGQIHAEVGSRRPTEPLTASSATSKGTANSKGASGAAPIAQATQAAFAGEREIRLTNATG
jgi:hypothetical protein